MHERIKAKAVCNAITETTQTYINFYPITRPHI